MLKTLLFKMPPPYFSFEFKKQHSVKRSVIKFLEINEK